MNFEFVKECRMESVRLQEMYEAVFQMLEKAEWNYWSDPRECGIILREAAGQICRIYNCFYEVGYPDDALLEEFLCYTGDDSRNAMVSRFLSVARKEQRDRLNKLRILGDDCLRGAEGDEYDLPLAERMPQNVRVMMETMMEAVKDMCQKINKREDLAERSFLEEALPEGSKPEVSESQPETEEPKKEQKKSFFGRFKAKK